MRSSTDLAAASLPAFALSFKNGDYERGTLMSATELGAQRAARHVRALEHFPAMVIDEGHEADVSLDVLDPESGQFYQRSTDSDTAWRCFNWGGMGPAMAQLVPKLQNPFEKISVRQTPPRQDADMLDAFDSSRTFRFSCEDVCMSCSLHVAQFQVYRYTLQNAVAANFNLVALIQLAPVIPSDHARLAMGRSEALQLLSASAGGGNDNWEIVDFMRTNNPVIFVLDKVTTYSEDTIRYIEKLVIGVPSYSATLTMIGGAENPNHLIIDGCVSSVSDYGFLCLY